jgi:hypothetical protein
MPTNHVGIMKANEEYIPWDILQPQLHALESALHNNEVGLLRKIIKTLVTGYAPSGEIVDWIYMAQEAEALAQRRVD